MPVKETVHNVETTVTWNGTEIPVAGFSVNFGMNITSTAQIFLALGLPFDDNNDAKPFSPASIREGDKVTIEYKHHEVGTLHFTAAGGTIFEGIVSGVSASHSSTFAGTNVGSVVNCIHQFALIGDYPLYPEPL